MAKEFKDYDKIYASFKGTALESIERVNGKVAREDIDGIDRWPYIARFKDYSADVVRNAVYEDTGVQYWQKFRVSLKGLTTKEKLYCLGWYWDVHISPWLMPNPDTATLDLIRVNNYISALKRGGLLDSGLRIIK